jgi:SAM-dependent methyltransferase
MPGWIQNAHRRRARRARDRQASYQAVSARQRTADVTRTEALYAARALTIHALVNRFAPLPPSPRVVEVGCGGVGVVSYLPDAGLRIGVDPLALEYQRWYARWPRRAAMGAAAGEALPFRDAAFDLVLCDNVIDHAERPSSIVSELCRVLRPGGVLFFTVNVHHPLYQFVSRLHGVWNAIGLRVEIGPFADHTVHFTPGQIRRLMRSLPLTLLHEDDGVTVARAAARAMAPRHLGDRLKRLCFKNARYTLVARRSD